MNAEWVAEFAEESSLIMSYVYSKTVNRKPYIIYPYF